MTNKTHSTLYVGVTSNLIARVQQHKMKVFPNSFTAKYNCVKLVYYKMFYSIEEAIAEEKRIKGSSRAKKMTLINEMNTECIDLWDIIKKQ